MTRTRLLAPMVLLICGLLTACSDTGAERTSPNRSEASDEPPATVLVLHSYTRDFQWTESMDDALRERLNEAETALDIRAEFMDTKRYSLDQVENELVELYQRKYSDLRPDVIVVSDNAAFDFIGRHRAIFGSPPIVFMGLNNFRADLAPPGFGITGVVEDADFLGTVELMRDLQSDLASIAVVTDEVLTGKAHRQQILDAFEQHSDRLDDLELIDLSGLSAQQLATELMSLGSDTAVLHMSLYQDTLGRRFTADGGLAFVDDNSRAPVYVLWNFWVGSGSGAIGGRVTSGRQQGLAAADMALEILGGTPVDQLPIQTTSPNEVVIGWPAFVAHGFDPRDAPPETRYVDRPDSFFQMHRSLVLGTAALLAALVLLICVAAAMIRRLRRTQQRLLESRQRVDRQNENLSALNQDLTDFAYSASHDLKSPIISTLGMIDMAVHHLSATEISLAEQSLERASSGCKLVVQRVEDLLRFTVDGPDAVAPEHLNFPSMARAAWRRIEPPFWLELVEDYGSESTLVSVDCVLSTVLENLLSNAASHRDLNLERGVVSVRSWESGGEFVFSIADDGVGIAPTDHQHVGRPFRRFGEPTTAGSGLGLSLAKNYVRRLGGTLTFASEPGKGSTFTVSLPQPAEGPVEILAEPKPRERQEAISTGSSPA